MKQGGTNGAYDFPSKPSSERLRRVIFWGDVQREAPSRPNDPSIFPKTDSRHWHDFEFAGWGGVKRHSYKSKRDGPKGKRILCLKAESDAYQQECERSMLHYAGKFQIDLTIQVTGWDQESHRAAFMEAVESRPDMIIHIPPYMADTRLLYETAAAKGVPVIVNNLIPDSSSFAHILAWIGHDAWNESRQLARTFAELMDFNGDYAIVQHMPGNSSYIARTWGIITELSRIAPSMRCIAAESGMMRTDNTESIVRTWLRTFGRSLRGIVSANDFSVLNGINRAMDSEKRSDIIRVSNGTTRSGLESLKSGRVHALTFKSPALDGAFPIQLAVDWFNGLNICEFKYLPVHVITRSDVDEFIQRDDELSPIPFDGLREAIGKLSRAGVDRFFDSTYLRLSYTKVISFELFRGFTIELLSQLIGICQEQRVHIEDVLGSYETIYRNLFNQPSFERTMEWMREVALSMVETLRSRRHRPRDEQMVEFVEKHFDQPLSLKLLAGEFDLSSRHIGRIFVQKTGRKLNDFLRSLRVERAKIYLASTSLPVTEISGLVGFSDPNYFHRVFRSLTASTASDYRKANQVPQ
jgi:AraC-like DNA-binding protein/ABC-type sugar transport system substrate-binding protein